MKSIHQQLNELTFKCGSNFLITQGAGGNTSVKHNGQLIIKASGKRMANAVSENIFVEIDLKRLNRALDDHCEIDFNFGLRGDLRGSIETPLHAVIPQPVVVHVHSVRALSFAIRRDGQELLRKRLEGIPWEWVPYARPGWPLTWELQRTLPKSPTVWILQNHGLIVAGLSCAEVETLLWEIERRLETEYLDKKWSVASELGRVLESDPEWRLASGTHAHYLAFCPNHLAALSGGIVCPDEAVFLGPGLLLAEPEDTKSIDSQCDEPAALAKIFVGQGVALRRRAGLGAEDLLGCLGLVAARLPDQASLSYLSSEEVQGLLNWEAERYRQQLDKIGV